MEMRCYICGRTEESYLKLISESIESNSCTRTSNNFNYNAFWVPTSFEDAIEKTIDTMDAENEYEISRRNEAIENAKNIADMSRPDCNDNLNYRIGQTFSKIPQEDYQKFMDWDLNKVKTACEIGFPMTDTEKKALEIMRPTLERNPKKTIGHIVKFFVDYYNEIEKTKNTEVQKFTKLPREKTREQLMQGRKEIPGFSTHEVIVANEYFSFRKLRSKTEMVRRGLQSSEPTSDINECSFTYTIDVPICPICEALTMDTGYITGEMLDD